MQQGCFFTQIEILFLLDIFPNGSTLYLGIYAFFKRKTFLLFEMTRSKFVVFERFLKRIMSAKLEPDVKIIRVQTRETDLREF